MQKDECERKILKIPGNDRIDGAESEYMSVFDAMGELDLPDEGNLKKWRYIFSFNEGGVKVSGIVTDDEVKISCSLPYGAKFACSSEKPAKAIEDMMILCSDKMERLNRLVSSLEKVRDRLAMIMLNDGVD